MEWRSERSEEKSEGVKEGERGGNPGEAAVDRRHRISQTPKYAKLEIVPILLDPIREARNSTLEK